LGSAAWLSFPCRHGSGRRIDGQGFPAGNRRTRHADIHPCAKVKNASPARATRPKVKESCTSCTRGKPEIDGRGPGVTPLPSAKGFCRRQIGIDTPTPTAPE
jgi:hypothetical protein